jgi:hypothetical protein
MAAPVHAVHTYSSHAVHARMLLHDMAKRTWQEIAGTGTAGLQWNSCPTSKSSQELVWACVCLDGGFAFLAD